MIDGTLTGNAASLTADGTLNGSNLGYQENNVLDLNSRYTVSVPELDFAKAHVEATSDATFVKVAGMELNSVTATTTYDQTRLDFKTNIKEKTRELDATGQVVLHPDHQEVHLPELAIRTQGIEWRTAPGSQATVNYSGNRVQLEGVRLVSGDQSLELTGGWRSGRSRQPRRSTSTQGMSMCSSSRRWRCRTAVFPAASPRTPGFRARPLHLWSTARSRSTTAGSRRITTIRFG